MAHYLNAHYYLFDHSKNTINESSSTSDFENFIENLDVDSWFIKVSSRHSWSAIVIYEILAKSCNIGALSFLTEIRTLESEYKFILISSDSYTKIVTDINDLILWCKSHVVDLCQITQDGYSATQTLKFIENIDDNHPDLDLENIESLFSYLKRILKMIDHAEKTQQTILCFNYRS